MKRIYVKCLLCAADAPKLVKRVKSLYSDDLFNLVKCSNCGLMYINPWEDWTEKEKRLKLRKDDRGFEEAEISEADTYRSIIKELSKYKDRGKILDIGCAAGGFLRLAKQGGWDVYGVEINKSSARFASKKYQLNIFGGTIQEAAFPDNYFDAVVIINTIEHIHQPVQFMQEIRRILKNGGFFYAMTPNYNNYLVRMAQKFGYLKGVDPIDPTGHPCIYCAGTLKLLLRKCNFKILSLKSGITGQIFTKRNLQEQLSGLFNNKIVRNLIIGLTGCVDGGSTLRAWAVKSK